jgi:nitrogen regulatory protein PII
MTQETALQNTTDQRQAEQGLLMLIVPPNLEEMLVDVLLQQAEISGFTSHKVHGHGRVHGDNAKLSIVEQVTGRQQRVQFMMHANVADLKNLVGTLKARFRSTDIHYILLPILEC